MKLTRMIDPSTLGHRREAKVHYLALNGKELMCGHGSIYREVDGERFTVWQETKRPVNCSSCTKRIETMARFALAGLTSEQYEDVLAHLESFKQHTGESDG